MKFFNRKNSTLPVVQPVNNSVDKSFLAEIALKSIHDGVVMTDRSGAINFINPAAVTILECNSPDNALSLDYGLLIKIETKEGRPLEDTENPLIQAMANNQPLENYEACLILPDNKRVPVSISVLPVSDNRVAKIITFRDITKELAEDSERTEFISTASHEMRTPVASIEGYLSLSLNPQTATIDERARGYLESAYAASQHLGQLFRDLLDTTKLDDNRVRPNFVPVEMISTVRQIVNDYAMRAKEAGLSYQFGSEDSNAFGSGIQIDQVVYGYVDVNFLREIMGNLIDNAIKYTPKGGSIYINALGDGDRVLINVTDTGIGISTNDIQHVFQKFYRADNSDTRTVGGTGLGLYLVKQRVEAMGGRVWAESAFGEGTTFYVSLPRISGEEYEKRMIAVQNQQALRNAQNLANATATPVASPTALPTEPILSSAEPVAPAEPTPLAEPITPAEPTPPAEPVTPAEPTPPASPPQPEPSLSPQPEPINNIINNNEINNNGGIQ